MLFEELLSLHTLGNIVHPVPLTVIESVLAIIFLIIILISIGLLKLKVFLLDCFNIVFKVLNECELGRIMIWACVQARVDH